MARKIWTTLLTKTHYIQAALVLEQSLRDVGSKYPLVVMVAPDLDPRVLDILRVRDIATRPINYLRPAEGRHNVDAHDERFRETWAKLRAFDLDEYERVILLDSDMIVVRNMDELMDRDLPSDWIAAVHACACNHNKYPHYPPDWRPENCAYTPQVHPRALTTPTPILPDSPRPYGLLNSGLVILTPSKQTMAVLEDFLATSPLVPNFKFPDQDLLAAVFKGRWQPIPWKYNALKTLRVIHSPIWCEEEIRCLHYVMREKPWHFKRRHGPPEYEDLHEWWYKTFDRVIADLKTKRDGHWELVAAQVTDKIN